MEPPSVERAREIVNEIRSDNGGIAEETRTGLGADVLRAFESLQSIAGRSIRHVAEDLYDTDTRFIFELLQNAEDNRYSSVLSRDESPYINFTLHGDRLVVDSNEDGFNEQDVRAICSIHNSSKPLTGGYIGHKGIGFKSVFKVAQTVHIQSGPFSFSFKHRRNESGLGMITPSNQEHDVLPDEVRTRITLSLIHPDDFDARAKELTEIPDTLLLFLRKLKKITVDLRPPKESAFSSASYEFCRNASETSTRLSKMTNGEETVKNFIIRKATVSDLPEHPSRQGLNDAEVVLAFPVDASLKPIREVQYVYSFLPMRREGFKFLIQSDFITQASRQGIHHCPRNYAIRDGICDLFIEAVCHFCHQPSLQYEWLQYLPRLNIMDPFWSCVRETIFCRLRNKRILLTWKGKLRHPERLQHLSSRHCDRRGQPLFDDLECEVYLSPRYKWSKHADDLMELGVKDHSDESMLDRLDSYLRGDKPRFLDPALDNDWHTRVAKLLVRTLKSHSSSSGAAQRIKNMPLVPVSDGSRLKSSASGVYFPNDSKGVDIPGDLDLDIVHPEALGNPSRKALFDALGVTHCGPSKVIKFILKRYNLPHLVNLQNSISHLLYFFWSSEDEVPQRMYIMDRHERPVYRARVPYGVDIIIDDLYFQTPGRCGTKELSRKLESDGRSTGMLFIHEAYLGAVSTEAKSNGWSWEKWLKTAGSVLRVPRLRDRHADKLSNLFQNIAISHPLTLVDLLRTYWPKYRRKNTPQVIKSIKHVKVPCQNTNVSHPLKKTYFPSAELKYICFRTSIADSFDLFIEPLSEWATVTTDGWGFLAEFGVGLNPDIVFMEHVLRFLKKIAPLDQAQNGFFALYQELSVRYYDKDPSEVRNFFQNLEAVYIPATQTRPARITSRCLCVWNGNPCLRGNYPLAMYQEYSDNPNVAHLFKNVLCVVDANIETYLTELQFRKASPDVLLEDLYAIYGEISKELLEKDTSRPTACDLFDKRRLVYIPAKRSWVSPDECIWTAASNIGGQFGISATYAKFEGLFRGILNVQVPTTTTYINQLRDLVSDEPDNITAIKAAIHSMCRLRPSPEDLHGAQELRFLPIEKADGSKILAKVTDAFFIADRIEYQAAFRGKVSMLDFSLEEVCRLHRLFESLSLGDHYMSAAVQERTTVQLPAPEPSSSLTHIFRRKAQHLYRCAVHYDAGRLQSDGASVRRRLQTVIIHESDGFKKTVILSQDGLPITAETDKGLVYIDHSNNRLKIYVPRDPRQRQRCYSTQLPKALVSFLEIEDRTATEVFRLACLLQEDVIENVLDDNGILYADADVPDSPTEATEENSLDGDTLTFDRTSSDDGDRPFETGSQQGPLTGLGTATSTLQHADHEPEPSISHTTHRQAASLPRVSVLPHSSEPSADTTSVPALYDSQYIRLLGHVIMLARQAAFPQQSDSAPTIARVNGSSTQGLASGIRSGNQLAHDIKTGAAGELFVFELLSQQNLPDFTRENWRSNVRKEVNVHPQYLDLEPWSGVETADLVYKDAYSVLTRILVDSGYLPQTGWEAATPTYFIEIKTTTGACETPFYMSKGQYRRMQSMKLEDHEPVNVYMVFRVYNLGSDGTAVRIYLDPETLREEGTLQFTSESYSVSPRVYY